MFREVETGACWVTPEFNGDKSELQQMKSNDSCDKDWEEIFEEFKNVKTLDEFQKQSAKAQGYYRSCLPGAKILPAENIGAGRFEESDLVIEEIYE
jgi:hypothetical protein